MTAAEIEERNDQILLQLSRGAELKVVAHRFRLSYSSVWLLSQRNGLKKRRAMKREQARKWLQMFREGLSIGEIARRVGVPETTCRTAINKLRRTVAHG